MVNAAHEGQLKVDLYIPRKCSWTNRLLTAKDHASVQINVAQVDPVTGVAATSGMGMGGGLRSDSYTTFCTSGYIRFKAEGDMALTELVRQHDLLYYYGGGSAGGAGTTSAPIAPVVGNDAPELLDEEE